MGGGLAVGYTQTPPPLDERPLEGRILEVRRRLARLQERIRDQCPGEHRYVQHLAWKLPWCDHCGFTDAGLHRTENSMSHSNGGHHLSDDDLDDEAD